MHLDKAVKQLAKCNWDLGHCSWWSFEISMQHLFSRDYGTSKNGSWLRRWRRHTCKVTAWALRAGWSTLSGCKEMCLLALIYHQLSRIVLRQTADVGLVLEVIYPGRNISWCVQIQKQGHFPLFQHFYIKCIKLL